MRTMSTEQFLDAVFGYPMLYDVNDKDFKSIRKKDKVWEEIGKMLNASGEATKKKWRNLRDSYIKYLKCIEPSNRQAKKNYKRWPWAMQMEKFKPFFTAPKSKSNESEDESQDVSKTEVCVQPDVWNIDDDLLGGHNAQHENSETDTTEDVAEPKFKKRKQSNTSESGNVDKVCLEGEHKNKLDSTDYVMLGYSKTIKTFSRARQAEMKLKIAQLVYQGELEQIREELSTPGSSLRVT